MKPRYIIISLVILTFVILAIFSFSESTIDYSNFAEAKKGNRVVQVICSLNKNKEVSYDENSNELSFSAIDEVEKEAKVIFSGPKPNNFDIAPHLVVKGIFIDNIFRASEILTKCPSKYDAVLDDLLEEKK